MWAPSMIMSKRILCKFFKKGKCEFGDDCRHSHSRSEQQEARKQEAALAKAQHRENVNKQQAQKEEKQMVRSPCPVPEINIQALVNSCASGELTLEKPSWSSMSDDFSDDEEPGIKQAASCIDPASSGAVKKGGQAPRKARGLWADMNDDSSDEDIETTADDSQMTSADSSDCWPEDFVGKQIVALASVHAS